MRFDLKTFFIAFSISFVIFFSTALFFSIEHIINANDQMCSSTEPSTEFIISKQQDINIFLTVCQQKPAPADIYILIKISACDDLVSLVSIPKTAKTFANTKCGQLQELFDWGGVNCAKEAVENFMDVEIDRTVQAQNDEIVEIIDDMGGVRVDDGKIIYGEDYCEFLRQNPVAAIVALKTSFASKADLSKFFSDTAKLCSTTFSQYDFEIRESGFEQMLRRKSSQLFLPKLEFESTNSHDRLTPSSKAECQKTFSKEEVYN